MAYDPNWDPNNGSGHNKSPIGGPLEDWLREGARQDEEAYANGTDPNHTYYSSRGTLKGLADFVGGVQGAFYGDQNHPGLIGGTRQVNPNAYWDISGDPYRNAAGYFNGQGPGFGRAEQDQTRQQQQNLIQMLVDQSMGRGPSVADAQLRQATDRNINAAASMAASGRGPGATASAYNANNMAAGANQQAAADSGQLRLQEQLQARQLLGSALGQTRGQDQNLAALQLQDKAQRDSLVQKYMQMGYDADQANRQAALDMEKLKNEAYKGGSGGGSFLGGLFSSMSDEREKTNIKAADKKLSEFLDALDAHSYEYKDPKNGHGRRISVMAQELEKSELGKEFVFEAEGRKRVDYGKGLGTMLAAQAALHKRIKKLEASRG